MSTPLASTAARPPGIRLYATLVVALAAFLASMVVLRVPFRGYLIEARLTGRLGDGLDPRAVESWLKAAAPGVHVRVQTAASGHCDVTMQQIAPRAGEAQITVDRVARQFAEHYVAERREAARQARLASLQAELQTARGTEDAIRARLDELRQEQAVAATSISPDVLPAPTPPAETLIAPQPSTSPIAGDVRQTSLRERIEQLRAELAGLLGHCTEAHPKVITLRAQIAGLEGELAAQASAVASDKPAHKQAAHRVPGGASYLTALHDSSPIESTQANLAAATRARQWAERQLQAEVAALASAPGYPWSVEPARVLARVGGTPRTLTLVGAALITLLAATVMFFASAVLVPRLMIQSTDDLTGALALPLVARMQVAGRPRRTRRVLAPWLVQATVHAAEILLAAMFLALAFTMLSDRWLAGQIIADPFGVLSEVAGRVLG
jgi:hypothetical protein